MKKKLLALGALAASASIASADIISDTVDAAEAAETAFETIGAVIVAVLLFMIGVKFAKRAAAKV